MRVEDNRWIIGSRDIWHGVECFEHCLKVSMAVAAEEPAALEMVARHKESRGVEFRKAQGNEYEALRNAELAQNLGDDFVEISSGSDSDQVVAWAKLNKVVIAQAPFKINFGDFDYSGRADLLVRSDYQLGYKEDGTLTAEPILGAVADGKYVIWEIKHSSKFRDGKVQPVPIYEYQLAMAYEGLSKLGVASSRSCGIVFKYEDLSEFDPEACLANTSAKRSAMFELLNSTPPHAKKRLVVKQWRCDKPALCKSAKCDYSDICGLVRYEEDSLHQIYNIHHTHVPKYLAVGITKVSQLLEEGPTNAGVAAEQVEKHIRWARVITKQRETGEPQYEIFSGVFEGPDALPARTDADLFVDFEWYTPLNTRGNYYYMFGILNRQGQMQQIIAKDGKSEGKCFQEFLDAVDSAILANPDMHFYVANKTAEGTGITKLGEKYASDQDQIARILDHMFDVQVAAKASMVVGGQSFGLKEMAEHFSGRVTIRTTETTDGDDSMWQYHEYLRLLESGQTTEAEAILADIATYNEQDCRATLSYYDWLASR